MTTDTIIDSLVNAMGLAGVLALIVALRHRNAPGGMRWRWTIALGLVAVIYASRGLQWLSAEQGFTTAAMVAAGAIPLAALLVVEGLIRRHAPPVVKLLVLADTVVAMTLLASGAAWATPILGAHIGIGLALGVVTALVGMRGLDHAETRAVIALALCQIALIPAALSDYHDLLPEAPTRLSPLAILLFGWVGLTIGAWGVAQRLIWLAFLAAVAALTGIGLSAAGAEASWIQIGAVVMSALMLVTICTEAIARPDAGLKLRQALVSIPAGDPDALVQALSTSEIFGGSVILSESDLEAVEPDAMRSLFAQQAVLSRRKAPWNLARGDIAADAIVAILDANAATHLLMVNQAPLALLAINLPALSASDAVEIDLAFVQRLLSAAHGKVEP